MRRAAYLISLAVILLGLARPASRLSTVQWQARQASRHLSADLLRARTQAEKVASQFPDLNEPGRWQLLNTLPFGLLIFQEGELTYWNRTDLPPAAVPEVIHRPVFKDLPGASFILWPVIDHPNSRWVGALPVVRSPAWTVTLQETSFPVTAAEGNTLFFLDPGPEKGNRFFFHFFYLTGLLVMTLGLNRLSNHLLSRYPQWSVLLMAGTGLFVLRSLSFLLTRFQDEHFFTPLNGLSLWNPTAGDFFINGLLLVWLTSFFHRSFETFRPRRSGVVVAAVAYGIIAAGILGFALIAHQLIVAGGLNFELDNVFRLGLPELIALIGLLLIQIALYIFSHRLIWWIQQHYPNQNRRLLLLTGAGLVVLPLSMMLAVDLPPLAFFLSTFVFLILNDLFIETRFPGLTQIMVWLLLFAMFDASLLYNGQAENDQRQRLEYARLLSTPTDQHAEKDLVNLAHLLPAVLDSTLSYPVEEEVIRRRVDARLVGLPYLFRHYQYDLFTWYGAPQQALLTGKRPEDAQAVLDRLLPTADPALWRWDETGRPYYYVLNYKTDYPNDSRLLIAFRRLSERDMPGYQQLIATPPYRQLDRLDHYDYAVYRNGQLTESRGWDYPPGLSGLDLPGPGNWQETFSPQRVELTHQSDTGVIVRIGRKLGGPLQVVTLFSFIFLILSLLVIVLAVVNHYVRAILPAAGFPVAGPPSLRNRIQLSLAGLILGSFLLIGIVTGTFFQRSRDARQQKDLVQSAELVRAELERSLAADTLNREDLVQRAARRYRHHIDLYRTDGRLLASSSTYLFNANLRAPLMAPEAFGVLRNRSGGVVTLTEKLGQQPFLSAYLPLNTRPLTYLGLPSPREEQGASGDAYQLLATLLNVYVFLLVMAGVITIVVANSIAQPLTRLGEKLRDLRLGRNEPLEWQGQDEIAGLIAAYNRMISELEEHTERLKQSEREGAWREMAQQVAHEIKNPLTPMKLSLQHLLRAYENDPQQARELLKRTGKTLIEQIDGLARIASEFSTFAKLPAPEPENLLLNELLTSVADLFRRQSTDQDALRLKLPGQPVPVRADRSHLQRVLNNLLQNAWQAIPKDRKPRIELTLECHNGLVRLGVRDNGSGIPPEMANRVFQPRFTTKSSGMGLGLAMCKEMVEQMDGKIWFRSDPGAGTTFFIELPEIKDIPAPE